MIIELILTTIIIYYIVVFWIFRKKQKESISRPIYNKSSQSIIGKSFYTISKSYLDDFKISKPMELDVEMVYDDSNKSNIDIDLEIENEEIVLLTGGVETVAQGLSFEEMAQTVHVIQQENTTDKDERKALQTISLMQQTDLFEMMIEQINGGRQRVAEMLDKYENKLTSNSTESVSIEIQNFNIGDYL